MEGLYEGVQKCCGVRKWTLTTLVVPFLLDVIFREVDAPFAYYLRDSSLTTLDAIRDAYSSVATAGESEAGNRRYDSR